MAYKPQYPKMNMGSGTGKTMDTAVKGILDITKVAVTGTVAVGVISATGAALKK